MKMFSKVLLTAAAMAALAAPAMAADKLIVKDAAGASTAFKVTDTGVIGAAAYDTSTTPPTPLARLGIGTLAPGSTLSVVDEKNWGGRGLAIYQNTVDANAAMLVFRKSRGNYAVPVKAEQNDFVGAFHGQAWDGSTWLTTATINYFIDGPTATGSIPQALLLSTGTNVGNKVARMFIGSDGKISVGNGTAPATISGTGLFDMNADTVRLRNARTVTPSTTACNQGEISWDANYIYVCTATNSWKRASLTSY